MSEEIEVLDDGSEEEGYDVLAGVIEEDPNSYLDTGNYIVVISGSTTRFYETDKPVSIARIVSDLHLNLGNGFTLLIEETRSEVTDLVSPGQTLTLIGAKAAG